MNFSRSSILRNAHEIRRTLNCTFGEAQKLAWRSFRLKAQLRAGATSFSFQKESGEVRLAIGTLNGELFAYIPKGGGATESALVVRYFDLEKQSFRSVRIDRLISIAA